MFEQVINVDRMEQTVSLFGSFDENIRLIEAQYNVKVVSRGSEIKVSGDAENVSKAVRAINGLLMLINRGEALSEQNVRYVLSLVNEGSEDKLCEMTGDCVCITAKGKPIKPKMYLNIFIISINLSPCCKIYITDLTADYNNIIVKGLYQQIVTRQ